MPYGNDSWDRLDFTCPQSRYSTGEAAEADKVAPLDFQKMIDVAQNVASGQVIEATTPDDTLRYFEPFRRILLAEYWLPLMLEVSLIQDRRKLSEDIGSMFFVSHIASYIESRSPGSATSFLDTWNEIISDFVKGDLRDSDNRVFIDIVPNVNTYSPLFHFEPLDCSTFQNHTLIGDNKIREVHQHVGKASSSAVMGKFNFQLKTRASQQCSLDRTVKKLSSLLCERLPATTPDWIKSLLTVAQVLVVPFSRMIEYDAVSDSEASVLDAGNPGGCFFAIVVPEWRLPKELNGRELPDSDMDRSKRQRRAAVRISFLLQQAAFREVDHFKGLERDNQRRQQLLLSMISHALQSPLRAANDALENLCSSVRESGDRSISAREVNEELMAAERLFRRANSFARCIDLFVGLDPLKTPADRAKFISSRMTGTARFPEVLDGLKTDPIFAHNFCNLIIEVPTNLLVDVDGNKEAWGLVLYLLLKNAAEAARAARSAHCAPSTTLPLSPLTVTLRYCRDDPNHRNLSLMIRNACPVSCNGITIDEMNSALNSTNCFQLESNTTKTDSMGIGLVTCRQILGAWKLDKRAFRIDPVSNEVVFELDNIVFKPVMPLSAASE